MIEHQMYVENDTIFQYRVAARGILNPHGWTTRYRWIEALYEENKLPGIEFNFTVSNSDNYPRPVAETDLGVWFHFVRYEDAFAYMMRWGGISDSPNR